MFKALSSLTRRKMLKLLSKGEMHVSGLARELGISVPVAAKHVKLLEEKGLIERRKFGKSHVLKARMDKVRTDVVNEALDMFSESFKLEVPKGANVLDALKQVSGVRIEKIGDREFVTSVDGDDGYYIFEVDGSLPNVPMDKVILKENAKIELKKLMPVKRKEMNVKVK